MNLRWIIIFVVAVILALVLLKGCSRKTHVRSGTIVFLGDSLTVGYGLDPAQAYPSLIHIPGMTAISLGVSGSKTDDGLQRLKDYFGNNDAPSLVVIALGANDILHSVAPAETEANLKSAIQECKSRGIPVLLCGVRIPGKFGTDSLFADVAGETHVPLLPDLLQGAAQNPEKYLQDDGHPNAEGQKLIAEGMQSILLKTFSFGARGKS